MYEKIDMSIYAKEINRFNSFVLESYSLIVANKERSANTTG